MIVLHTITYPFDWWPSMTHFTLLCCKDQRHFASLKPSHALIKSTLDKQPAEPSIMGLINGFHTSDMLEKRTIVHICMIWGSYFIFFGFRSSESFCSSWHQHTYTYKICLSPISSWPNRGPHTYSPWSSMVVPCCSGYSQDSYDTFTEIKCNIVGPFGFF